jgi:ferrous iron transport protein A
MNANHSYLHFMHLMLHSTHLNTNATTPRTLEGLHVGESARILALNVEGDLSKRFSALGLRPGNWVRVLRSASLGGPMHLRVGTTELILRRHEARSIALAP